MYLPKFVLKAVKSVDEISSVLPIISLISSGLKSKLRATEYFLVAVSYLGSAEKLKFN
jgi:hypothetical protein